MYISKIILHLGRLTATLKCPRIKFRHAFYISLPHKRVCRSTPLLKRCGSFAHMHMLNRHPRSSCCSSQQAVRDISRNCMSCFHQNADIKTIRVICVAIVIVPGLSSNQWYFCWCRLRAPARVIELLMICRNEELLFLRTSGLRCWKRRLLGSCTTSSVDDYVSKWRLIILQYLATIENPKSSRFGRGFALN